MKQNIKDENLDNINFVLYIALIPTDCHIRFEYVIKAKLLSDLNSNTHVIHILCPSI